MESQAGRISTWLATGIVGSALMLALAGCAAPGDETSATADEAAAAASTASVVPDPADADPTAAAGETETGAGSGTASDPASDPAPGRDDESDDAMIVDVDGDGVTSDGSTAENESADRGDRGDGGDGDGTGGTEQDGSTPSTTAPPSSTTATTVTAADLDALDGAELEDFIASRYEAFWDAFGQARTNPTANPAVEVPILADLAADEQLEQAHADLVGLAERGQALRSPSTPAVPGLDRDTAHRVRVDRVDDAVAELTVCFVNDRISYQVADGAIINDAVVTVTAQATMVRTDRTWKLVRSQAVALDPGVAGCWLEDESRYPW